MSKQLFRITEWQNASLPKLSGCGKICIAKCWRSRESIGRITLCVYTVLLAFAGYMAVRDAIFDYPVNIRYDLQWLFIWVQLKMCPYSIPRRVFLDIHENFKQHQHNWNLRKMYSVFPKPFQNSPFYVLLDISWQNTQTEICAAVHGQSAFQQQVVLDLRCWNIR